MDFKLKTEETIFDYYFSKILQAFLSGPLTNSYKEIDIIIEKSAQWAIKAIEKRDEVFKISDQSQKN